MIGEPENPASAMLTNLNAENLHPALSNNWTLSTAIIVAGLLIHLLLKLLVFPTFQKAANRTENDLDDRLIMFARRFFAIILWFIVFVLALKAHGIQVTAVLASAGIAGIAIGLAAKETLSDILAGIFIISDQPIRIGDRVKLERIGAHWGGWGDVLDIGLRRTKIRNSDGVVVNYPNSVLATSVITNFSDLKEEPIRARIRFQIGYHEDIDNVMELASRVINDTEGTIDDTVTIVVRSLWDEESGALGSGVLLEGRYNIENVKDRTRIRSRILINLLKAFQEQEIKFGHAIFEMAGKQSNHSAA